MSDSGTTSSCPSCGKSLSSFEVTNKAALGGTCVDCYASPHEQYRRQAVNDMGMSPFTSVQQIHSHLLNVHHVSDEDLQHAVMKMSPKGADIYNQTNQTTWRSLHEGMPHEGHSPASTHTSDEDPFQLFNDRRQ